MGTMLPIVRDFLVKIFLDNEQHVREMEVFHSRSFTGQQKPLATVLMCSDSRVQKAAFHRTDENDLFMIRNIGNQIETSEGSVEYGINHLRTPLLFIIGHSACGAIKAGMQDFSNESPNIQRELRSLDLSKACSLEDGILHNTHNQVDIALKKFPQLIERSELAVVGAVYDFRNDFHRGYGRMTIMNINGERDKGRVDQILDNSTRPS